MLSYYDDLVAPLVNGNAHEIISNFHKLDKELGR